MSVARTDARARIAWMCREWCRANSRRDFRLCRERSQYGVARVRGCFENADAFIGSVKRFVTLNSAVKDATAIVPSLDDEDHCWLLGGARRHWRAALSSAVMAASMVAYPPSDLPAAVHATKPATLMVSVPITAPSSDVTVSVFGLDGAARLIRHPIRTADNRGGRGLRAPRAL